MFVQWAKFLPHSPDNQTSSNVAYDANQPQRVGEPTHHGDHDVKVPNAVNWLRDAGYLMLQPEDEIAIWVFELPKGIKYPKEEKEKPGVWVLEHPKPVKAAKEEKEVDYAQILRDCGFTSEIGHLN